MYSLPPSRVRASCHFCNLNGCSASSESQLDGGGRINRVGHVESIDDDTHTGSDVDVEDDDNCQMDDVHGGVQVPTSARSASASVVSANVTGGSVTSTPIAKPKPFTSPPTLDISSATRRSVTPSFYPDAAIVQSPVQQAFAFAAPQSPVGWRGVGCGSPRTSGIPHFHSHSPSGASAARSRVASASSLRAMAHAHAHAMRPPAHHPYQHPQYSQHQHHVSATAKPPQYFPPPIAPAVQQYAPALAPAAVQLPDGTVLNYSTVALPVTNNAQDQLLHLAHAKYNQADFASALSILQTLFLINPSHIPTLLLLGCTCYSLALFPLSAFYNQLILHLDPSFAEAYSNLGTTYRAMGDDANAEQCYRVAVSCRPEYWDGARNLVGILCARSDWAEALAVYERCEATVNAYATAALADSATGGVLASTSMHSPTSSHHHHSAPSASTSTNAAMLWPPERKRDLYHAKANIKLAMGDSEGVRTECIHALRSIYLDPDSLVPEVAKALHSPSVPIVPPQKAISVGALVVSRALVMAPTRLTALPGDAATTASILQTLAKLYQDSGQLPTALALYYVALAVHANPQVCNLVGILCATVAQPAMAVQYYHSGLTMDPNHVHLYTNLGSVLKDQGHVMQAISMYERAVTLEPTFDIALANLANAMKDLGRIDEAVGLYRRALTSNPNFIEAFCNYLTDRQLDMMLGQLEWSASVPMGSAEFEAQRVASVALAQRTPAPSVPTVLPFHTFTYPLSARQIRLISYRNAARMVHNVYASSWYPAATGYAPIPRLAGERLRVGYLSSDFGNHPLSHLMQSVFGMHDTAKFEVFCYALSANDGSPYRAKIEREVEHFMDVSGWDAGRICDQINRVDRIHVMINLNGYTKGALNEVFAARCAPVQLAYMGFAGTLGCVGWIDYFIVDPVVAPPDLVFPGRHVHGKDAVFATYVLCQRSQQGFRDDGSTAASATTTTAAATASTTPPSTPPSSTTSLPRTLTDPDAAWLDDEALRWRMRQELFPGLSRTTVILANFNQLYKLDPSIFRTWCSILSRVPNAIIWLLRFPAQGEPHLKRTATEIAGPEVASRIVFTDVAPKHIHISRGRVVDLFLDTPECNAHTTACDILFSGTPIVTFPRHRYKLCSRVAASIALATGYGERMIVASEREYEERVVALASSVHVRVVPQSHLSSASTAVSMAEMSLSGATGPSSGQSLQLPPVSAVLAGTHMYHHHHPADAAIHWSTHRLDTIGELYDLKRALFLTRESSPLFDTLRWVRNLETGYEMAWSALEQGTLAMDNLWVRDAEDPSLGDPFNDPRVRYMAMVDARAEQAQVQAQQQQALVQYVQHSFGAVVPTVAGAAGAVSLGGASVAGGSSVAAAAVAAALNTYSGAPTGSLGIGSTPAPPPPAVHLPSLLPMLQPSSLARPNSIGSSPARVGFSHTMPPGGFATVGGFVQQVQPQQPSFSLPLGSALGNVHVNGVIPGVHAQPSQHLQASTLPRMNR
ncbi:glycosyl transferase family 41-domain-containing protein [Catenaria anguillulae PL171]|uniref:protein O-GlcNAc transferase n=1 Tax=Catenaria anguillulae PL171 TaxID=765915 RepID=A0A1Y2HNV6_9FUNG|nr:glycosyl transferase family 41-domain-containing protein [Catenaria anguillulae PL171]